MGKKDDNDSSVGWISRQEGLTILMFAIFGIVVATAGVSLIIAFQHPDLYQNITVTGDVDLGSFIDKTVESYDAFLALLGVTLGGGLVAKATVSASRGRSGSNGQDGRDNDKSQYEGQIAFLKKELHNSETELSEFTKMPNSESKSIFIFMIKREIRQTKGQLQEKERYLQELMNNPSWNN